MNDIMQLTSPSPSPTSASIVPVEGGNLELSAQRPDEIVQCHAAMIEWTKRKISVIEGESLELKEAFEHAKKCKWKFATLERHWKLSEKRIVFYRKMLAALEAGYHIIPPMRVELFAIRTNKSLPDQKFQVVRWVGQANFQQEAKVLPQGDGEYQNPHPMIKQQAFPNKVQEGTQVVEKYPCWASDWDEIEFPANMARVHVMEATTRAMALKIFDDLGMLPADRKRNPDPMIIGRIYDPRDKWMQKSVHFLIAWHIDTRTL